MKEFTSWVRDESLDRYQGYYEMHRKERVFNGIKVRLLVGVTPDLWGWVALSSGKKRKHLNIFEDKGFKNKGLGIEVLIWAREEIESFKLYYPDLEMMCIGASDSRRFRIYKRWLEPDGYRVTIVKDVGRVLCKKYGGD